jgi:hypothetical protein
MKDMRQAVRVRGKPPFEMALDQPADRDAIPKRRHQNGADQRPVAPVKRNKLRMAVFGIGQRIERGAGVDNRSEKPDRYSP